jgi:hypothetical protein
MIDIEDYVDSFVHLKQKDCNDLFANLISTPRDGISSQELKYDPGSNIPYPKEKHVIKEYEIELTENRFSISSLPSIVAVKW